MTTLRPNMLSLALTLAFASASAQQSAVPAVLTAEQIMARVATNQDRAEAERAHYVYLQHAHVISRKGKKLMCEEVTDARVTPSGSGSHVELLRVRGQMLKDHAYVSYTTLPVTKPAGPQVVESGRDSLEINIGDDDRQLVESMRASLTANPSDRSKDGIDGRLFPLTSKTQGDYLFRLLGRERMNGRDVFHIDFRPKDKSDFDWKGEAYVDADAYQPVVIITSMSRNVPLAVRALLGTNVPGLGFSVTYAPQADGVWFPVSFGTEFKLHVLFFFHREIIIAAQNSEFEKTHVSSKIVGSEGTGQ